MYIFISEAKDFGERANNFLCTPKKNTRLKSPTHSFSSSKEGIHPLSVEMVDNSQPKPAVSLAADDWHNS